MDKIFHEKQEGYLCAQHCLNALLQEPFFSPVDLSDIAKQLDEEERKAMAERGEDTDDYRRFIEQPSGNMDDSGYFSVQVINRALKVWNLELIPYSSTEPAALAAKHDPSQMKAFICNYKDHWFTIRKLGNQWFNLNSMLSGPQLITDTYLAMFLAQLLEEKYSIFVVIPTNGEFPTCEADKYLLNHPIQPSFSKPVTEQNKFPSKGYRLGSRAEEEAKISQTAKALGNIVVPSTSFVNKRPDVEIIGEVPRKPQERIIPIKVEGREEVHTIEDDEDDELQRALQLSLENYEMEHQNKNLQLRLDNPSTSTSNVNTIDDEDDELRKALQLSLECVTAPQTPDQEDIRWHRLAYLGLHSRGQQTENSTKLNT